MSESWPIRVTSDADDGPESLREAMRAVQWTTTTNYKPGDVALVHRKIVYRRWWQWRRWVGQRWITFRRLDDFGGGF